MAEGIERQIGCADPRPPAGSKRGKLGYDEMGRVIEVRDGMDRVKHTLAYERLENGTARTTISETCCGPRIDEYDARGMLTGQEDALGNRMSFVFDESFRLVSRTDRNGHTTTAEYGPAGHPTKVTDPMGNVTRYEYANEYGFLTAVVDALGRRTSLQYDGSGNAVGVTDAAGGSWRLGRDGWGQVRERAVARGVVTS